jgi:hypothetical protein
VDAFFVFLGIGVMSAIISVAGRWSKAGFPGLTPPSGSTRRIPVAYRMDPAQQQAALEAYKHAVSEKMDVLRTAINMGWGNDELKALDARLEQLIGADELRRLTEGEIPTVSGAAGMDPAEEISRLRTPVQAKG